MKKDLRDWYVAVRISGDDFEPSSRLCELPGYKGTTAADVVSALLELFNGVELSSNFLGDGNVRDVLKKVKHEGCMTEEECPAGSRVEDAYNDDEKVDHAEVFRIDSFYVCRDQQSAKYALETYNIPLIGVAKKKNYLVVGWTEEGWLVQGREKVEVIPYDGIAKLWLVLDFPSDDVVLHKVGSTAWDKIGNWFLNLFARK